MPDSIKFTSLVDALPSTVPFVGPEALERRTNRPFKVRLGANESAFGISFRAQKAMQEAVGQLSWYGDPENWDLVRALATYHQVAPGQISVGCGIDDLLGLIVRVFVERGDPVITSLGSYPTLNYHVQGFGGRLCQIPYRENRVDVAGLAAAAGREGARLVYLANPDNPTGTWSRAETVRDCMAQLPEGCMLVLDEAYADFAPSEALIPMAPVGGPVIRLRTFSKAHGMAGARVGYGIADERVVEALNKVRHHFGVNRVAQVGALAALEDRDFVRQVVQQVAMGRDEYAALAVELGLKVLPSATNFVAMEIGVNARRVLAALLEAGVFVRMPAVAPLDRFVRVTVGSAAERDCFADIFRQVMARFE